ncbi:mate-domain-containing protein [Mycena maculata]|uniref:Mate-domain-containing protein n=1 Tax=Mycena maculata TaxID=230809 RepID=A0AAD7NAH3_9AGAR|nr:mate-domain-containing protein [Mycena maculata]
MDQQDEATWTSALHPSPSEHTPLLHAPTDKRESYGKVFCEELITLIASGLPILGTHIFEHSLIITSVVTIGHLSTNALAGVALGSMTAGVSGFSIIYGLSSALDTLLPSAWTSQKPELVGLWTQRMIVVEAICLIPMFVIWFNSENILLWLRQDPEIARLAATYLYWISLGLPAYAFNSITRRYFQSQGLFAAPTRIVIVVAPVNAFMNWLLVWGPKPIRLGYIGAPIATALSFNLISLLSIAYGFWVLPAWNRQNKKSAWHPICRGSFQNLGLLFHLGLAGVAQIASEWWAWELAGLAASQISPLALAAQSILLATGSTAAQGVFALESACSVRIGNLLGEGRADRAPVAAIAAMVIGLASATSTCAVLLAFRKSWAYMFTDDPEVAALYASILPLVGLYQFFDAGKALAGGILRARGKQGIGALLNLSGYYLVGMPLGLLLTFHPKIELGLRGLWIGLTVSLLYCAAGGGWICAKTDWDEEVRRVRARIAKEWNLTNEPGSLRVGYE